MWLEASTDGAPSVFVTTGTDRFPMDRLVAWVDHWMASAAARGVRCIVQRGTSRRPEHASSEPFVPFEAIVREIEAASAVVTHAGTGSVMLARKLGAIPIVIPRERRFGEAVDDHQVAFARRMAKLGEIVLATDEQQLIDALDLAVGSPERFRRPPASERASEAIQRFEWLVAPLLVPKARDAISGLLR
jgi:UDP-N-acetylglucosamine transferase subunit ALG13